MQAILMKFGVRKKQTLSRLEIWTCYKQNKQNNKQTSKKQGNNAGRRGQGTRKDQLSKVLLVQASDGVASSDDVESMCYLGPEGTEVTEDTSAKEIRKWTMWEER